MAASSPLLREWRAPTPARMPADRATLACGWAFGSELAIVITLLVTASVLTATVPPRVVSFRERDPSLSFAWVPSTVSTGLLPCRRSG